MRDAVKWGKLGVSAEDLAEIDSELEAILVALDDPETGGEPLATPWYSVGIHVWVIPKFWRTKFGKKLMEKLSPEHRPGMVHLHVHRAKKNIKLSGIKWTIDRGTIGTVWKSGEFDSFDFNKYANTTEAQWVRLGEDVKRGLTFADLVELRKKYGSILVVALSRDSPDEELIGCLVLDTPAGMTEDALAVPYVIGTLVESGKRRIARKIP